MAAAGNNAIIHSAVPVMERLTGIHCGKDVRDENVFGTVIFLNAVPAGGTGDQVQTVKNVADLPDSLLFVFIERVYCLIKFNKNEFKFDKRLEKY